MIADVIDDVLVQVCSVFSQDFSTMTGDKVSDNFESIENEKQFALIAQKKRNSQTNNFPMHTYYFKLAKKLEIC